MCGTRRSSRYTFTSPFRESNIRFALRSCSVGSAFCQKPCCGLKNFPNGGTPPHFVLRAMIKASVTIIDITKGIMRITQEWKDNIQNRKSLKRVHNLFVLATKHGHKAEPVEH